MQKKCLILLGFFVLVGQGCKWVDDFRERQQPQYLERVTRPTLNPYSVDYKGDDTHCEEDEAMSTSLPEIDELSPIPDVPEHPAGVGFD